jgi:hypothetical protein
MIKRLFFDGKYIFLILSLLLGLGITFWFLFGSEEMPRIAKAPSWRGITPGETTEQEVIQVMGQPDDIEHCRIRLDRWRWSRDIADCFSDPMTYKYNELLGPKLLTATHEIRFRSGRVWAIAESRWPYLNPDLISVEKFVENYGLPEKVTWSGLSPHYRAILFCQQGVMVQASRSGVIQVFYFTPMPLNKCLQVFRDEVATEKPFLDSDVVVGPADLWGFNQRQ